MEIKGSVILVTGGTSGIGLETAIRLSNKGASVIITGRNEEKLASVSEKYGLISFRADSGNESDVLELFLQIEEKFGRLDAVINNAGYGYFESLVNSDKSKFEAVFNTNVTGAMLVAREASKIFIKQKSGNIINIASTAAYRGFEGGSAYTATKFALRAMTECWRAELRKYNIRVVLINPSEVQTDFIPNSGRQERPFNESKLISSDISDTIICALELPDRAFITELTVFATNPKD